MRDFLRDVYAPARPRARRTPSAASGTRPPPAAGPARTSAPAGPRGGLRLGLVGAPADPRRAADRGGEGAARRDADGGHALARHQRAGRRGRGGDPRPAAADDGRRDRRAGRHALRPRRAGAPRRGDDRPARQRGRAVLHPAGAGLLPARAAPGCRPWAAPASRSGTWSRPGTTRASPAITCSSRSGPTWRRTSRRYQTSLGSVGANVEGWALYAERLMDELGYLTDPGERLGYLDAQQLRSVRVVIDIGMHLGLPIPDDAEGSLAEHRGQPWTPELARAFLGENSGADVGLPRQRAGPLPRHPRAGDQLQAGRAGLARGPGGGAGRRAAPTSTSRPGTWRRCRRARSASTTSPPSSRGCSAGRGSAPVERRRVTVVGVAVVRWSAGTCAARGRPRPAGRRCTPRCRRRRCSSGRCR